MKNPSLKAFFVLLITTVPLFVYGQIQPRFAESITARNAPAVQPTESVTLRNSPAVQPTTSPAVTSRQPIQVQDTSVPPGNARDWPWQQLPTTSISTAGIVGGGSRLTNIRCAGVSCRTFDRGGPTGDGWAIATTGGFPTQGSNDITTALGNIDTKEVLWSRQTGSMSDGSFSDIISTGRLAPGDYLVSYRRTSTKQVLGAVTFSVAKNSTKGGASTELASSGKELPTKSQPKGSDGFVGVWYANSAFGAMNATGTIELTADGRYIRRAGSVQFSGRYVIQGDEIHFDGQLKAWDGGRASIDESVIRFAWREDGVNMEFRFRKG
jgi:hypothetical protein